MKRLLALFLMIILVAVPVTAVAAQNNTQASLGVTDFVPRLTAPSYSNQYYYSNLNIFYSIGYGLPNCTAYAWGRAYELLGSKPKLSLDSAHYWYDYNKDNNYYPYGKTPKLGAIACWDNPYGGHVAVVEKITSTTITMSHSAYGGQTFYTTECSVNASNGGVTSSGWKFKGYIYILDGEILPEGDVYKVNSSNGINLRKGAGTSYKTLTAIPNGTQIVVTKTATADGYTWGKTSFDGYDGWCVLDFCDLIYKKPEETKPTVPETTAPTEPETEPPTEPPTEATVDEPEATLPTDSVESPTGGGSDDLPLFGTMPDGDSGAVSPSDSEAEPVMTGDVNRDGRVTVADATTLQKFVAGMSVLIDEENADINGDGKITVADATYIQKILASLV